MTQTAMKNIESKQEAKKKGGVREMVCGGVFVQIHGCEHLTDERLAKALVSVVKAAY